MGSTAQATLNISFTDNLTFDDDVVGSMQSFTDPMTSVMGTITTNAIGPDGNLDTDNNELGIDSSVSGDASDSFDPTESWSFSWNVASEFIGIDFDSYSTSGNDGDQFSISSPDWIGRSITTGTGVTYTSGTGTFVFDNAAVTNDDFTAANLGGAVATASGAVITISFADINAASGFDDGASEITDISFNLVVVPEPSAFLFGGLVCGVIGLGAAWRRVVGKTARPKTAA
jgi:hypothetical protein